MEGPSIAETPDENNEKELSFEKNIDLARTLMDAVDERNKFTKNQGGFDTFAEAGQYANDGREEYKRLESLVSDARKTFDESVSEKSELVERLVREDDADLADRISQMFHLSKKRKSWFSRD